MATENHYLATREQYDAMVARMPKEARGQWWPVPWRIATRGERAVKVMLWAAESLALIAMLAVGVYIASTTVESYGLTQEMLDVCLKHADTGYEIERCDRGRVIDPD